MPFMVELTDAEWSQIVTEASPAAIEAACSPAVVAVLAKRIAQVDRHGYTPEHDQAHDPFDLASAAYFFATIGLDTLLAPDRQIDLPHARQYWPWMDHPVIRPDARDNLINAAAMILATLDRLDAAAQDAPLVDGESA